MKRLCACVLTIALLLALAGCKKSMEKPMTGVTLGNTTGQTHSDCTGISVQIGSLRCDVEKTELTVLWQNETAYDAIYGATYVIERKEKDAWVSCAKIDNLAFEAIGYELKAGNHRSETYNLTNAYDISVPGLYRFRSNCFVYTGEEKNTECKLWAEFTVETNKEEKSPVPIDFTAQYIRTNGYRDGAKFPGVQIINSLQELQDYYAENREMFYLERVEKIYSDSTIGFLNACDRYDQAFFEKNFLTFVLVEEGSGSVRHHVDKVELTEDKKINISIAREVPEIGTSDMAEWHIILELSRDVAVATTSDILVYLDGDLRWNGGVVELPKPEMAFKKPPESFIRTYAGNDITISASGYNWTYEKTDGTAVVTIADQAGRPVEQRFLEPIRISDKYAETVYAPIPGSTAYAPTNSLGYFVKLTWETYPSSVTITCWPDTVWKNNNTPEETVVSHEGYAFYAKPGSYVYEIVAEWSNTGVGYYGSANYYVYIIGGAEHVHQPALQAQTVKNPFVGYCGNTQTTLHIGEKNYTFMAGHSVTLTDILLNLDYQKEKLCDCMPAYTVDTEFGKGYGVDIDNGYARCEKGQADLTEQQIEQIRAIVKWAETTNAQYR